MGEDEKTSKNWAEIGDGRGKDGRFAPGHKSNGGRKRQPKAFRETVLKSAPEALETVLEIMRSTNARASDRLRAAEIVIERAYGKPDSTVRLDVPKQERLDDIRAEIERIKAGEEQ